MGLAYQTGTAPRNSRAGRDEMADVILDCEASTLYVTGGLTPPHTPRQLGLGTFRHADIPNPKPAEGYIYDGVNNKLIFTDGAGNEIGNGVDVSARKSIRIRFHGQ